MEVPSLANDDARKLFFGSIKENLKFTEAFKAQELSESCSYRPLMKEGLKPMTKTLAP